MRRFIAMFLTCVMLFSTMGEVYVADVTNHGQGCEDVRLDDVSCEAGLMEVEMEAMPEEEAGEMVSCEDILSTTKYSTVYNNSWDKYSSNYFYNQLSGNDKKLWDAMDKLCLSYMTGTQDVSYDGRMEMITLPTTMYPEDLKALWQIFIYSNPQYYFLLNGFSYSYNSMTGLASGIALKCYNAFLDGDARAAATKKMKSQITAWETELKKYSSVANKIKVAHDLICNKVVYNHDFVNGYADEQDVFSQSAYSVFCTNTTVCAGYSDAMAMMCNGQGIDAVSVTSYNHQWNKIRYNDSWYNYDLTWDDTDSTPSVNYTFYARSDEFYDTAQQAYSHQEESFWEGYLPKCTLDTNSSYSAPGSYPKISSTVATPTISVSKVGDEYKVTIKTSTSGAKIYYTLDGKTPGPACSKSYIYTGSFYVGKNVTIKAIAVRDRYNDSKVVSKVSSSTTYKITYVLNGGTNNSKNPSTYKQSSTDIKLYTPTKKGYTFVGWYTDKACTKKVSKISAGTTGNKTFYAKWKLNTYKIKFDGNGATSGSMSTMTAKYANTSTLKANTFKRKGYVFAGWNTAKDGSKKDYADKARVKNLTSVNGKTVVLYAQWKKVKYKITYVLNGGTNSSKNPSAYYVTTEKTLSKPTKKGYNFVGWYTDKACTKKVTKIAKGSTGNKTFYAKWKLNTYKIKFDGNGATSGTMSTMTLKYANTSRLTMNAFKRKGYVFAGWNTAPDGSKTDFADGARVKNLTVTNGKTITLYAQWKKSSYSITYVLNGGKNNAKNPSSYKKQSTAINLYEPTKKGYTFVGWYSDKACTKEVTEIAANSSGDKTFYAKWKLNTYTIVFDGNGATDGEMESMTLKYANAYTLRGNEFERRGYMFVGWNTAADGSGAEFYDEEEVKNLTSTNGKVITLYAQWELAD